MDVSAAYTLNTLTTIRYQTTAGVISAGEGCLVKQIHRLFYSYSHFNMSNGEENVHDVESGTVCSLVSENVKRLCVNVNALNDSNLCSFADCANDDS